MTPSRIHVALVAALAVAGPARAQPADAAALERLLAARLEAEGSPTCALAGFAGERSFFAKACTPGASAPTLAPEAWVEIGSVSKALTGLLAAQMAGKGELDLDATAVSLAPPGAKLPSKGEAPIRVRHLLSHTSGLPRLPADFRPTDMANPYATYGRDALYASLASTSLARAPGEAIDYSNLAFMWLSELLGRKAGMPYDRLMAERVFAPLDLKDISARSGSPAGAKLAQGHDLARAPVPPWDLPPEVAGVGGIRATSVEMMKLAESLAGLRPGPLDGAISRSLGVLHERPGGGIAWGWVVMQRPGGTVYWHNGGTGGMHTMLAFSPDRRRAAWIVVDNPLSLDDLALHLVDPAIPVKKKREAIALDAAALDEVVGTYEIAPGFSIAFTREGTRLFTQATGQPRFEAFAEAKDRFFLRAFDAQMHFRRDDAGRVTGFVLRQGGRETPARRTP